MQAHAFQRRPLARRLTGLAGLAIQSWKPCAHRRPVEWTASNSTKPPPRSCWPALRSSAPGLIGRALVNPEIPDKLAINIAVPEAAGAAAGGRPRPSRRSACSWRRPTRRAVRRWSRRRAAWPAIASRRAARPEWGPTSTAWLARRTGTWRDTEYSNALKSKQGPWTFQEMNQWLTKPSALCPRHQDELRGPC